MPVIRMDNPLEVSLPTPVFWDALWKPYRLNGVINLSLISQFSLKHASNKVGPQGKIGASYTFCHINPSSVVGSSSNYTPGRSSGSRSEYRNEVLIGQT